MSSYFACEIAVLCLCFACSVDAAHAYIYQTPVTLFFNNIWWVTSLWANQSAEMRHLQVGPGLRLDCAVEYYLACSLTVIIFNRRTGACWDGCCIDRCSAEMSGKKIMKAAHVLRCTATQWGTNPNPIKESKQVPGAALLDGQYHSGLWTTLY